jgi:ribosomal-protein-alanine N-acetyltransferase
MGLNRIQANCMLENTGSERVMQKAGMSFEGIMREGVFAKGRYQDLKTYAILKKEWEKLDK